ncbi:MAG: hypothetical protein ALECFALPRED_000605 [Alectoria fallacina]|uniref:Uncharacterized protein n=1 Tax=Alectoria fallacina TaxID=1903189 RepID=A0A8H3EHJ9_9LECA|nr:MAG: hypothetical protein ALECFALPRED_000605 [Alectoria fallacina]
MLSSPSLPPDQSLRITKLNKRYVLLSVSEKGIQVGVGSGYSDLYSSRYTNGHHFFAESVALTSSVFAPYRLTVSTWGLVCPKASICLNVTGEAGVEDGESGKNHGRPGGSLQLFTQDLDDESAKALTLLAQGGAGGNAKMSDVVGNGGNGDLIRSVLQPTYVQTLDALEKCW